MASKRLRTPAGTSLGKAKIVLTTTGGDYTVCAVVAVAKAHRQRSTLVKRDLRERGPNGEDLGRALAIQRATQLTDVLQSSSFVPEGHRFVLKAWIDIGAVAKGKVTYRVPAG